MLKKQVAVVILNWNGKHFLEKFLPSVITNSPQASIVVADNASTDDSIAYLKTNFPEVEIVINNQNYGFAEGYNQALKKVDAEYYVLLNSDVEVSPNWLEPILDFMAKDKTVAACQPKILDYNNKNLFEYAGASGGFIDHDGYPFCRGRIFQVLEEDKGQYNEIKEVFWATGACLVIRSEMYHKVEGFDGDYFAHMEEIDLCWRLKNLGQKIYCIPTSVVYHVGGGTLNKLSPRKTYLNFRNNLITLTKNNTQGFLFTKIFKRMVLDGVAAYKFLFEGNAKHFWAVAQAHFGYYKALPSTLRKRKKLKKQAGFSPNNKGIFNKNLVFLHYIKKIKYYSQIIERYTNNGM